MAIMEMSRNLRQTIDNSLEEGQFENAILSLDQMRTEYHRPSVIHLLHLIFLALHPSDHAYNLDDPYFDPAKLIMQSPRKIVKQGKSALLLTPEAVQASRRLLYAFLTTNGVSAFADALPAFPESRNEPEYECEYVDSPVFNQAVAIRRSRNVWEVLKAGYTKKTMKMFCTPSKGRGKQPRSSASERTEEWSSDEAAVGNDSWFLLEWLVSLFEKDAEATHKSGLPKHSPMLLKQLPPPPIGTMMRWDASEPLKVAFYAFQQKEPRRRKTGIRLLLLLIDLTQSNYLNLPSFASSTLTHLSTSLSPTTTSPFSNPHTRASSHSHNHDEVAFPTHHEAISALFSVLPTTPPVLSFKISICKQILSEFDGQSTTQADPFGTDAPIDLCATTRSGLRRMAQPVSSVKATSGSNSMNLNGNKAVVSRAKPRPKPKPKQKIPLERSDTLIIEDSVAPIAEAVQPTSSSTSIVSPVASMQNFDSSIPPPTSSASTTTQVQRPPLPPLTLPPLSELIHFLVLHFPVDIRSDATSPWIRQPSQLLRVKFELLMAWVGIWARRKARRLEETEAVDPGSIEAIAEDQDASGELEGLIDAVFGPNGSEDANYMDIDEPNEPQQLLNAHKTRYNTTLRIFSGLPVNEDTV